MGSFYKKWYVTRAYSYVTGSSAYFVSNNPYLTARYKLSLMFFSMSTIFVDN